MRLFGKKKGGHGAAKQSAAPQAEEANQATVGSKQEEDAVRDEGPLRIMISYEWKSTVNGKSTKSIVDEAADWMEREKGWAVWYDRKCLGGGDIVDAMSDAIDDANIVVVILTDEYERKVNFGDDDDNCKREFRYAAKHKAGKIVPLVASDALADQRNWKRKIGFSLGEVLFQKLGANLEDSVSGLAAIIEDVAKPAEKRSHAALTPFEEAKLSELFKLPPGFNPLLTAQIKASDYEEGTREAVLERVRGWYKDDLLKSNKSARRVMVFLGPAGFGKSVLMAKLCYEGGLLTKRASSQTSKRASKRFSFDPRRWSAGKNSSLLIGAAHFFKFDDANAASVRTCLYSIANQLAGLVPGVKEELRKLDRTELDKISNMSDLFREVVAAPCKAVGAPTQSVVVVLDALDEVAPSEKDALVNIIKSDWIEHAPDWLGLLVSSRPEDPVRTGLKAFKPRLLELGDADNKEDVKRFLRAKLERYLEDPQKELAPAVELLAGRAEGLFLYARFIGEQLSECDAQTVTLKELREDSETFPEGLDDMYRINFLRFLRGPLKGDYVTYQALFGSMAVARETLPLEVVGKLLGIERKTSLKGFLRKARVFLDVHEDSVAFIHKSMSDFLLDEDRAGEIKASGAKYDEEPFAVDVKQGHASLAEVLAADPLAPFAARHIVYHFVKSKQWDAAADKLLDLAWLLKVAEVGAAAQLVQDVESAKDLGEPAQLAARALEKSLHAISRDWRELPGQLLGRLPADHRLVAQARAFRDTKFSWLRPVQATLTPASDPLRKILKGHTGKVVVVALSVDGERIISGSYDNTVRVWDAKSGQELLRLEGHTDVVFAVTLSVDGERIVSGSWDKTVRVWDAESGQELRRLEGHTDYVMAVALSVDGERIVSGSCDKTVRVWDAESGQELRRLEGHTEEVNAVAFSVDGERIVSVSTHNTLRVWDAKSCQKLRRLEGHTDIVVAVALSVDGERIVSGSRDNTVRVWDAKSGQELRRLEGHTDEVRAVAFSVDGERIISGSHDGTVRVWDAESGQELRRLEGHHDWVLAVAFSVDGERIVSGSIDETVRVWDVKSGQVRRRLEGHTDYVVAAAISRDGERIVSGSWDKTVRVWDAKSGQELRRLEGHTDYVMAVALSVDGERVVSGSGDKTVRVWDAKSGQELLRLEGHTDYVMAVAFSVDGERIVSGSDDMTVRVWDAKSGQELRLLEGLTHRVTAVALSVDGERIVSQDWNGRVLAWSTVTGELIEDPGATAVLAQEKLALTNGRSTVSMVSGAEAARSVGFTCDSAIHSSVVAAHGSFVAVFDTSHQLCMLELVERSAQ